MRQCWNNPWMKWHVLSLVKLVITLLASRLLRTNRGSFSIYVMLVLRYLLSGSCLNDSSLFPTSYYHTKATFTVWALWLAADLKGCNLKHECCRFPDVCFSLPLIKNYLFPSVWKYYAEYQVCWKYLWLTFISCLQDPPPPCQHDMMLLFLKQPNSRFMRAIHACASTKCALPERVNIFYLRYKYTAITSSGRVYCSFLMLWICQPNGGIFLYYLVTSTSF